MIDRRREKKDPRRNPAGSKLGARQALQQRMPGLRMRAAVFPPRRRVVLPVAVASSTRRVKFFPSVFAKQLRVRVYTHPLA